MRSPYGPSRQRHWGRAWDREIGDPWGVRGSENPTLRQARAMQNGEYLGGVDMNQNEMNADGEDELLAAELQDDVVGSGIFDDPRRATANPDMGVLASRYALPGYLARERPFVPSEDVISASGAQVVPVPAGGMSYVASAAVGPNYEQEQLEMNVPGVHRTLSTQASSAIELLGEDAIAIPPQRAALDNPYYVEDSADAYLRPVYEGRTMVQFSGPENAHGGNPNHAKGRQIAAELYKWHENQGVGTGSRPHPVWGLTKEKGKRPPWSEKDLPENPLLLPGLIPHRTLVKGELRRPAPVLAQHRAPPFEFRSPSPVLAQRPASPFTFDEIVRKIPGLSMPAPVLTGGKRRIPGLSRPSPVQVTSGKRLPWWPNAPVNLSAMSAKSSQLPREYPSPPTEETGLVPSSPQKLRRDTTIDDAPIYLADNVATIVGPREPRASNPFSRPTQFSGAKPLPSPGPRPPFRPYLYDDGPFGDSKPLPAPGPRPPFRPYLHGGLGPFDGAKPLPSPGPRPPFRPSLYEGPGPFSGDEPGSSGLGTYLAYGLAIGLVGSMIYHSTKR